MTTMLHHLQAQAEFVVEEAQKRGVSAAEAFVTRNENLSLRLYRDAVDSLRHATTSGLGLRLINEQRPGYAFTSDLSSSGLTQLVIDCLENARYSQPDPELSFPEPGSPAPEMHELHHPEFRSFTLDQKIDVLREIESAAMDEDPRVTHILRNHFGEDLTEVAIPRDLSEAAIIDGCSVWSIFWRIILPLLQPITMTCAVLQTMWIWNDFLSPMLFLSSRENTTLVLEIYKAKGEFAVNWPMFMTMTVITLTPVFIFFVLMQKQIIKGIVGGAVKG